MRAEFRANAAMAAFLACCLVPGIGMLILPRGEAAAHETLAPVPALTQPDGSLNDDVLQETSDYVADHFAFREELITAGAVIKAKAFHTSAEEEVLLGEDGWLYYRETLADYLRTEPLGERALYGAAHTLALAREYCESRGARLLFTVAPNKVSLYPEHLPEVGEPLDGEDDIDRLRAYLARENVDYCDLFAAFRAEGDTLYHRLDSHWNARGAALAHDTLIAALGKTDQAPFFDGAYQITENHKGDLYEMLYPAGQELDEDAVFERPFAFAYTAEPRSAEDQRIDTACAGKSGSLLMFRDSFGNALHPFLADAFGRAAFSRAMPYTLPLVEETGADTVVIEIVERNLDWLTERAPIFPAPERGLSGTPPVGEASARVTAVEDGALPGYTRIEGAIEGEIDGDSPVYVLFGGSVFEACPVGKGADGAPFTLYVPAEKAGDAIQVLYLRGGALYAAAQVIS